MPALSESDMRVLAFERGTWRSPGAKEQGIAESLGMSATRYYQLLNELIDRPEALQFDPLLIKRLRAQRARRAALRSPQQGGTQPGGTQQGGTQPGGTQQGGTQPGGTQQGGTQPGSPPRGSKPAGQ